MGTEFHHGKVVVVVRGRKSEEGHTRVWDPRDDPHAQHVRVEALGPMQVPDLEHDVAEGLYFHGDVSFDASSPRSTRGGQDAVAVLDAHGRPHRPEVVRGGDCRKLVHWRERRLTRNDAVRGRNAYLSDEIAKTGVVVHEQ